MPTLRILSPENGPEAPLEVRLQGEVVLGRDAQADIPLSDTAASRRHARIHPSPEGWMLEDLGSSNGTSINGRPVSTCLLRPGDQIQIGQTQITFTADAPPPVPPQASPAPRRKRALTCCGCGCLPPILLLILAACWFLASSPPKATPALKAAAEFRVQGIQNAPGALSKVSGAALQKRLQDMDMALWPTVDPALGWSRFLSHSLLAAGKPRAGHQPILFYDPWADIGLVTIWSPKGQILDLQFIPGSTLRKGGSPPFGGTRSWQHQQAYGPIAVGALTAETLKAFENMVDRAPWPQGLDGVCEAFKTDEARTASRIACGYQFAQYVEEMVAFHRSPTPVRQAFAQVLREGPASLERAPKTPLEAASLLKELPPGDWAAMRPTAFVDLGEKVLVMAQHSDKPDLFLGAVFLREGEECTLERLDLGSFQIWYGATR